MHSYSEIRHGDMVHAQQTTRIQDICSQSRLKIQLAKWSTHPQARNETNELQLLVKDKTLNM